MLKNLTVFWTLVWHKWHLKGPFLCNLLDFTGFQRFGELFKDYDLLMNFQPGFDGRLWPKIEFSCQKTLTFQFVNWIFDKLALLMDLDLGLVTPGDLGPEGLAWIGTSVARVLCRAGHHVGLKWINHRSLMLKLFWHDLFPTLCQNEAGLNRSKSQSWMIISQNRK